MPCAFWSHKKGTPLILLGQKLFLINSVTHHCSQPYSIALVPYSLIQNTSLLINTKQIQYESKAIASLFIVTLSQPYFRLKSGNWRWTWKTEVFHSVKTLHLSTSASSVHPLEPWHQQLQVSLSQFPKVSLAEPEVRQGLHWDGTVKWGIFDKCVLLCAFH